MKNFEDEIKNKNLDYMSKFIIYSEMTMIRSGLQYIDFKIKSENDGKYQEIYYISVPENSWYYKRDKDVLYKSAEELENYFKNLMYISNFTSLLFGHRNFINDDCSKDEILDKVLNIIKPLEIHVYSKIRDEYYEFSVDNYKKGIDSFETFSQKKYNELLLKEPYWKL